eukprot:3731066-Amphidinium_carterae.1
MRVCHRQIWSIDQIKGLKASFHVDMEPCAASRKEVKHECSGHLPKDPQHVVVNRGMTLWPDDALEMQPISQHRFPSLYPSWLLTHDEISSSSSKPVYCGQLTRPVQE